MEECQEPERFRRTEGSAKASKSTDLKFSFVCCSGRLHISGFFINCHVQKGSEEIMPIENIAWHKPRISKQGRSNAKVDIRVARILEGGNSCLDMELIQATTSFSIFITIACNGSALIRLECISLKFLPHSPQNGSFFLLISRNFSKTSLSSSASFGISSSSTMRECFSGMLT